MEHFSFILDIINRFFFLFIHHSCIWLTIFSLCMWGWPISDVSARNSWKQCVSGLRIKFILQMFVEGLQCQETHVSRAESTVIPVFKGDTLIYFQFLSGEQGQKKSNQNKKIFSNCLFNNINFLLFIRHRTSTTNVW